MQVAPLESAPRSDLLPQHPHGRRDMLRVACGFAYVLFSLTCGWIYFSLLTPTFANDLWWPGYNLSGYEAFLVDATNTALVTSASGPLDLLADATAQRKAYDASSSSTSLYPTYVRHVVFHELTSVRYAIANLRSLGAPWSLRMSTQFCFVDFNQNFHLAHTVRRQARCKQMYARNGAVYLEAVLRNVDWDAFQATWGGPGNWFTVAVQSTLEASVLGREWLATTSTARATTSTANENGLWASLGINIFQLQWTNRWQPGISETIALANALGYEQQVTLKSRPRSAGAWTSIVLFWLPFVDMWAATQLNVSLVNNTSVDFGAWFGLCDSGGACYNQTSAAHSSVGPLLSIDTYYIPPPATLRHLYLAFQASLHDRLASDTAFLAQYTALKSVDAQPPTPPRWQQHETFYGGSLLCLHMPGTGYVQTPFDFADACAVPRPFLVPLRPEAALFAACALPELSAHVIGTVVRDPEQMMSSSFFRNASESIRNLQPQIIQFVRNQSTWSLLQQPLLDDSTFAVYGWVMLYDWVQGRREVLSVEGDAASIVLISTTYDAQEITTSGGTRFVKNASKIAIYTTAYASAVLAFVALLCILHAARLRFCILGRNLFQFNRVVGMSYIGRPIMLLRGITAAILLSSVQSTLARHGPYTRLHTATLSLSQIALVAGEANWMAYVGIDVMQILSPAATATYAGATSLLAWVSTILLSVVSPVLLSGDLSRTCISHDMDYAISCTAGTIYVGSYDRFVSLLWIQAASALGPFLLTLLWRRSHPVPSHAIPILLSTTSSGVVTSWNPRTSWSMDEVSSVLCALIPLRVLGTKYVFDLQLWRVFQEESYCHDGSTRLLRPPRLRFQKTSKELAWTHRPPRWPFHFHRGLTLLGLWYIFFSIGSSVSYLQVASVNLANDLKWAGFSIDGIHTCFANWLNQQLVLGVASGSLRLDASFILQPGSFDGPRGVISAPLLYGARLQYTETTSLEAAISALRHMDACTAPWLAASHCFLDANRTWAMASTRARQERCAMYVDNAAVYVETILRNVVWTDWLACWGDAFAVAFGNDLRTSNDGLRWLTSTILAQTSILDEVAYWRSWNVTHLTPAWQNFKYIGLQNAYTIQNAYGHQYAFTLQAQNGTFRLREQTTFKMYWPLAKDLSALKTNSSGIHGRSLLPTSANYAFANTTRQMLLVASGELVAPLSEGSQLVANALGPYGTIDIIYVPVPPRISEVCRLLLTGLRIALNANRSAQADFFAISKVDALYPVPSPWLKSPITAFGGSPLCPALPSTSGDTAIKSGMKNVVAFSAACSVTTGLDAKIVPTTDHLVVAALLANTVGNVSAHASICAHDPTNLAVCRAYLQQTSNFVTMYLPNAVGDANKLGDGFQRDLASLNVSFMQYARFQSAPTLHLATQPLFQPSSTFDFYAWCFVYDWVVGNREVVAFIGDRGNLTLLTDYEAPLTHDAQEWELPVELAQYSRLGSMYVTIVMISIACLVQFYIYVARGYVEVFNLLELNRVGGIVWVGRPLLAIRSLLAVTLLATGTIELSYSGYVTRFVEAPNAWYKTWLVATEVTWLVAIVNDVAMVFTRAHTTYYATPNSLLVWFITASLSYFSPVGHEVTIDRKCKLADLDLQVVCTSGNIVIGHADRLVLIVSIVVGCNVVCFLAARKFLRHASSPSSSDSRMLCAGAKYLFFDAHWTFGNVYYLDRASAVLNGILTYRHKNRFFALDIKRWRIYTVQLPTTWRVPEDHPLYAASRHAFPLTD